MPDENKFISTHTLVLQNREKLSLTGVTDVDSFDDSLITAYTEENRITITGEGLHIDRLSIEEGELSVDGKISSVAYSENIPQKSGILGKLFR